MKFTKGALSSVLSSTIPRSLKAAFYSSVVVQKKTTQDVWFEIGAALWLQPVHATWNDLQKRPNLVPNAFYRWKHELCSNTQSLPPVQARSETSNHVNESQDAADILAGLHVGEWTVQ